MRELWEWRRAADASEEAQMVPWDAARISNQFWLQLSCYLLWSQTHLIDFQNTDCWRLLHETGGYILHFWQGSLLSLGYFCIYIKDVDKQISALESQGKGNQANACETSNITSWSPVFLVSSTVADFQGPTVQTAELHRTACLDSVWAAAIDTTPGTGSMTPHFG